MDPNYKTNESVIDGTKRLRKLKDFRKFFSDTVITTTHFLKKCIKVPKVIIKDQFTPEGVTRHKADEIIRRRK